MTTNRYLEARMRLLSEEGYFRSSPSLQSVDRLRHIVVPVRLPGRSSSPIVLPAV